MTDPESTAPEGSPQPPFPFVLILLTALAGWAAITTEAGWIQASSIVGVVIFASAALYQSRTAKEPSDSAGDGSDAVDPWDERGGEE